MGNLLHVVAESNLNNLVFVSGFLMFLIAFVKVEGKVKLEVRSPMRIILASFGVFLMGVGIASGWTAQRLGVSVSSTDRSLTVTSATTRSTVNATSTISPTIVQPTSSQPSILSKCQWLKVHLPQSQEAIAAEFGLPVNRVQVLREGCGDTIDGFVIRGGAGTEYASEVEIQVPDGGCIDAPTDARVTGDYERRDGSLRAYSGTVRAMTMTYWPWCDELH
jgi:hypothetical protein